MCTVRWLHPNEHRCKVLVPLLQIITTAFFFCTSTLQPRIHHKACVERKSAQMACRSFSTVGAGADVKKCLIQYYMHDISRSTCNRIRAQAVTLWDPDKILALSLCGIKDALMLMFGIQQFHAAHIQSWYLFSLDLQRNRKREGKRIRWCGIRLYLKMNTLLRSCVLNRYESEA